jgi:SAM-dependent methyltransferase
MRLYGDLADWFHLLTAPASYEEEAEFSAAVILEALPGARTLLELGSGGGNNASFLKHRFTCTLTDLSEEMLAVSRRINPGVEHVQGDMRTLRLSRTFDAVFVHDAIMYMLSEADLGAAIETAFMHTRPGGVALFTPDCLAETFDAGTDTGGHDGDDGRALRYLEWSVDPDPTDTTFDSDFVVMLREPGQPLRVEHDHHTLGIFPRATWERLFRAAGYELLTYTVPDPYEGQHVVFLLRRPG